MRYATWNLVFNTQGYGTGPEDAIKQQAGWAEGAFVLGESSQDLVVGYFDGNFLGLDQWKFREISKNEAFAMAESVDSNVKFDENGRFIFSLPDFSG